jgi:hypothetical protein
MARRRRPGWGYGTTGSGLERGERAASLDDPVSPAPGGAHGAEREPVNVAAPPARGRPYSSRSQLPCSGGLPTPSRSAASKPTGPATSPMAEPRPHRQQVGRQRLLRQQDAGRRTDTRPGRAAAGSSGGQPAWRRQARLPSRAQPIPSATAPSASIASSVAASSRVTRINLIRSRTSSAERPGGCCVIARAAFASRCRVIGSRPAFCPACLARPILQACG